MTATDLADVNLPRIQTGANPQHLIVTLFGDYWFGRREHLPSSALVALAGEFEITPTSARAALSRLARRGLLDSSRAALSRLARRGLLDSSRVGRRTYYGLTPRAAEVLNQGLHRIINFGLDHGPWDGSWVVVIFSVPEDQRDVRHVLRTRLRWLGFAPLYDGVWVSPRAHASEAADVLVDLDVPTSTVLVSRTVHGEAGGDPLSAWDLDELRASYDAFVAEFGPLLDRVQTGQVGAAEALVARTQVMDVWRQFPNLDPELPEDALPGGWPRRAAQAIFADTYDALGPLAEVRFQQIVGEHVPDLARHARHFTTRSVTRRASRKATSG